jgi:DNA-binding Xre family transcriptional regulator
MLTQERKDFELARLLSGIGVALEREMARQRVTYHVLADRVKMDVVRVHAIVRGEEPNLTLLEIMELALALDCRWKNMLAVKVQESAVEGCSQR